jgi:hypothetical protein
MILEGHFRRVMCICMFMYVSLLSLSVSLHLFACLSLSLCVHFLCSRKQIKNVLISSHTTSIGRKQKNEREEYRERREKNIMEKGWENMETEKKFKEIGRGKEADTMNTYNNAAKTYKTKILHGSSL